MRVVICGGGVIGATLAYFLSRRGADVIVVERTGLGCAASGKAGGFLALDWSVGSPLDGLARRSFELHARLAEDLDSDWGYRGLSTYSGVATAGNGASRGRNADLDWLSDGVVIEGRLGTPDTTAQVHPARFTAAMMRAADQHGAELRLGEVTGIVRGTDGSTVTGVDVDTDGGAEVIDADAVVIAMGPWSMVAAGWLPLPAVFGQKSHSLVFATGDAVSADALFLELPEAGLSPEVFPRADGTTYISAISSDTPLPLDPAEIAPEPWAIERLQAVCRQLSPVLEETRIVARQACYRPVTRDGLPLIGAVPGVQGAYVATGHSVWGILNAPATGEALAELIVDGAARSTDLTPFDPGRLHPQTAR
jgi:glycine/D-amino acid oxidase-like deaminating enzyme